MATVTQYDAGARSSSLNQALYPSNSFAPGSVGELLGAVVIASGTVDAGAVTAAANGVSTFTRVDRASFGPSTHSVYMFLADQLTTGTAAMTVTFDCTGDDATGAIVLPFGVVGMSKTGATAIKQSTKIDDGAGATAPVFTFGTNVLTGNVTVYGLGEISSGGVLTPTNWTQGHQDTFSTPTIGGAYGYRNSGFTGTTVTWPGNETAHGGVMVELDTSSSGATVNGTAAGTQAGSGSATAVRTVNASGSHASAGSASASATRTVNATAARAGAGTSSATATRTVHATAAGTQAGTGSATGTVSSGAGTVNGTASGTQAGTGSAVGTRTVNASAAGTQAGAAAAVALRLVNGTGTGAQAGTAAAVGLRVVHGTASGTGAGAGTAVGEAIGDHLPADPSRTILVRHEPRTLTVDDPSRTLLVRVEPRTLTA